MGIPPTLILMLGIIGVMSLLAQRVAIPAPVLLAVAGVAWSLIPSLPSPRIPPEVILTGTSFTVGSGLGLSRFS